MGIEGRLLQRKAVRKGMRKGRVATDRANIVTQPSLESWNSRI